MKKIDKTLTYKAKRSIVTESFEYSRQDAIEEFDELKKIALNCFDKNGNPNVAAAIKAVENKAKIANLYAQNNLEIGTVVKMGEIKIDGRQLKLNIGEDYLM